MPRFQTAIRRARFVYSPERAGASGSRRNARCCAGRPESNAPLVVHALYCIVIIVHTEEVKWEADPHDDFVPEYRDLQDEVQDERPVVSGV